jgi:hypothetical protein
MPDDVDWLGDEGRLACPGHRLDAVGRGQLVQSVAHALTPAGQPVRWAAASRASSSAIGTPSSAKTRT